MKWMLLLPLVFGCAASEAERQKDAILRQQIRVSKGDPEGRCDEVGGVVGRSAFDYDGAVQEIRRKAYEKGGNFVRLDTVVGTYMISGVAFRCAAVAAEN